MTNSNDLDQLLEGYLNQLRDVKQNLKELNKQESLKGGGSILGDLFIDGNVGIKTKPSTEVNEMLTIGNGTTANDLVLSSSGRSSIKFQNDEITWDVRVRGDNYFTIENPNNTSGNSGSYLQCYEGWETTAAMFYLRGDLGEVHVGPQTSLANVDLHINGASQPKILLTDWTNLTTWEVKSSGDQFEVDLLGSGGAEYTIDGGQHTWGVGATLLMRLLPSGRLGINNAGASAIIDAVQNSTTGAIPVLELNQLDLSEEFIDFRATIGATNPLSTSGLGSYYGKARVAVNGTHKWLALYN